MISEGDNKSIEYYVNLSFWRLIQRRSYNMQRRKWKIKVSIKKKGGVEWVVQSKTIFIKSQTYFFFTNFVLLGTSLNCDPPSLFSTWVCDQNSDWRSHFRN